MKRFYSLATMAAITLTMFASTASAQVLTDTVSIKKTGMDITSVNFLPEPCVARCTAVRYGDYPSYRDGFALDITDTSGMQYSVYLFEAPQPYPSMKLNNTTDCLRASHDIVCKALRGYLNCPRITVIGTAGNTIVSNVLCQR